MIQQLSIKELHPHPDNRPLGVNQEKVEQIAAMMQAVGYDQSKPLKVRKIETGFQIIEGEHRWRAATKAGIEQVPAFVIECDDEEALIQLVAGNVQTDNHPLDVGIAALKATTRYSQSGRSAKDFGERIGVSKDSISRYIRAAKVWDFIKSCTGATLKEIAILDEISKCKESDWLWFHDLIVKKDLSKADAIEISKRIRDIDAADKGGRFESGIGLLSYKQEAATAKPQRYTEILSIVEAVAECSGKLPEKIALHTYDILKKEITQRVFNASESFLKACKQYEALKRHIVFKEYESALESIKNGTIEKAEESKKYYEDEANKEERAERERITWEQFTPQPGTWYELGRHRLYCGNNTDAAFIDALPNAAFAFADPPYNAEVDQWDSGFVWNQDYLQDKAKIVAVTPGIVSVKDFFANSNMRYVWAHSAYITNGMTRGALGFGNFILTLLFSKEESIHRNAQDVFSISISNNDPDHYHKGRKPLPYMQKLLQLFVLEGQTVIDPFLGSGTTLEACQELGMTCIGAELDPTYCKKIMEKYKANGVY